MIKINLVREGRAVRGAGAAPAAATVSVAGAPGASNVNNIFIIGLCVLGIVAGLGWWYWEKRELDNLKQVVDERTIQAQKLEAIIKEVDEYQKRKENLQTRIDLINQLKQNQKGPVRIMDQISRDLPDLVWLDTMEVGTGTIKLTGRGLNQNAIALFIENIKNDPYFEEPAVTRVPQVSSNPTVYGFDMSFGFTYQPRGAAGAAADTTTTDTTSTTTTTGTE